MRETRYASCSVFGVVQRFVECAVRRGRLLVPGLVLAAAALTPGRAEACGALPTPSYSIGAVSPSAGSSGVVRDVGIIVTGVSSSPSGGPGEFADVELIDDDSDEAVPLTSVAWFSLEGLEMRMAVHPVEALAPLHAYRLEARPLDETGTPGERFVSRFVTSEAMLEPLELSGELELSLRGAEVDIFDPTPCDGPGAVIGKRRALLADVRLPVPSGGQGVYQAVLHFSDHTPLRIDFESGDPWSYAASEDEPHEVRVMQWMNLEAGQALTLEQEVFEEGFAYAGCFTFLVWDPAGHSNQASACLPSLSPDEVRTLAQHDGQPDVAGNGDVAAEEALGAAGEYREERPLVFDCAFGPRAPSRSPSWLTLLLASSLLARVFRRRRA